MSSSSGGPFSTLNEICCRFLLQSFNVLLASGCSSPDKITLSLSLSLSLSQSNACNHGIVNNYVVGGLELPISLKTPRDTNLLTWH